eukprot:TRINITY_DN3120_c0_g1_i1.p1 TRINITY_DN3120_c0_g1~~TRINITY_DN3120_c0_g1_i1.p1  ORF type:complete len:250 (+),score=63.38 TRINITY_DN3120_c0_g1_i1:460-1209(+)
MFNLVRGIAFATAGAAAVAVVALGSYTYQVFSSAAEFQEDIAEAQAELAGLDDYEFSDAFVQDDDLIAAAFRSDRLYQGGSLDSFLTSMPSSSSDEDDDEALPCHTRSADSTPPILRGRSTRRSHGGDGDGGGERGDGDRARDHSREHGLAVQQRSYSLSPRKRLPAAASSSLSSSISGLSATYSSPPPILFRGTEEDMERRAVRRRRRRSVAFGAIPIKRCELEEVVGDLNTSGMIDYDADMLVGSVC